MTLNETKTVKGQKMFTFSQGNQIFGVEKTTNVVEKITWGLVIALLVLSIGMNLGIDRTVAAADGTEQTTTTNSEAAEMAKSMPATQQPAAPAAAPAARLKGNGIPERASAVVIEPATASCICALIIFAAAPTAAVANSFSEELPSAAVCASESAIAKNVF